MKTSRNLVFLGFVALLLFVGAAVSVRSRASTSAIAVNAPAAIAAGSQYQRASQPYYVPSAVVAASNQNQRSSQPRYMTNAAVAASSQYQRSSQPYYVTTADTASAVDTTAPSTRRGFGVTAGR